MAHIRKVGEFLRTKCKTSDDVFDLRKIPQKILRENYCDYEPFKLAAGCASPLLRENSGDFVAKKRKRSIPLIDVRDEITGIFPIDEVHQFCIVKEANDVSVAILSARIGNNIKIIIESMERLGYFLTQPKDLDEAILKLGDMEWISLRFDPYEQVDMTSFVRNHYCKIMHSTPSFNAQNIKKVGFIPKSGNDNFNNQKRVCLLKGDTTKMVAKNYARQHYEECNEKDKSPIYTLFTINVEMIPSNVQFFFDAKVEFGMFIDEPIPPNAIIWYEEFNVNDIEE